jgi:MFS transporter, putative metabolite transport protein
MAGQSESRTIQQYIDEQPFWRDGTPVASPPLTSMQWRIWRLAAAGKFFEGMVVFMTGVALPLIVVEFNLTDTQKGLVGASVLFGILIGATALGGLADRVGRKAMFIIEMVIFTLFLALVAYSPSFTWLVVFQFGMGLALGCDYPTAHLIISETMPSSHRGRLVLAAFAFQAVGALVGTGVGFVILSSWQSVEAWRWMYATAILPATLVLTGRFSITQSGQWLLSQGQVEKAERETEALLRRDPLYPKSVQLRAIKSSAESRSPKPSFWSLFSRQYCRATILASVPWFLQDLGTYGIGLFTPTILASTVGTPSGPAANVAQVIHGDILAAKGAVIIDVLLIFGFIIAVLLADRVGRIKLQVAGFIGCAVGLFLASLSTAFDGPTKIFFVFAGFMIFNFMTNMGPNSMTYLLAGEVFPTQIRGLGAGFAASTGKVGAVTTSFLFPVLLKDVGTAILLCLLVGTSLLGAMVTWRFRIETTGINLETLDGPADKPQTVCETVAYEARSIPQPQQEGV